jgi:hypothetical protein
MQKQLLEFDLPQPLSNALLLAPSSVNPSFTSVPAAHRRLATMMVNGMGGRAVPLLESVIACCSTSLTEPHGEERGDRAQQENDTSLLLNKCPGSKARPPSPPSPPPLSWPCFLNNQTKTPHLSTACSNALFQDTSCFVSTTSCLLLPGRPCAARAITHSAGHLPTPNLTAASWC